MGDAGPPLPLLGEDVPRQRREVTVLVSGFGVRYEDITASPAHNY